MEKNKILIKRRVSSLLPGHIHKTGEKEKSWVSNTEASNLLLSE